VARDRQVSDLQVHQRGGAATFLRQAGPKMAAPDGQRSRDSSFFSLATSSPSFPLVVELRRPKNTFSAVLFPLAAPPKY